MYALATSIKLLPILSLQTGNTIAVTGSLLIDISKMEVIALFCIKKKYSGSENLLLIQDIREIARDCIIIDSDEKLSDPRDLVRVQKIIENSFEIFSLRVTTDTGRVLGKVEDYTMNIATNQIQKIYIKQNMLHSFFGSSLIIDRTQIVEISRTGIIVRDTYIRNESKSRINPTITA